MQRHPFDLQSVASLLEFGRPVASAHGAEIRKQRSGLRTPLQDGRDFLAEPNQRRLDGRPARLQLPARITDGAAALALTRTDPGVLREGDPVSG